MRNALSDRRVALRLDSLLARLVARAVVAEFMIRTNLLEEIKAVNVMALRVTEADENEPSEQIEGRGRMVPVRSAVPDPLYSLDPSEHKSGSRQLV